LSSVAAIGGLNRFLRNASRGQLGAACFGLAVLGAGGGAVASAASGSPIPAPATLPQALYHALHGPQPAGLSATVRVENRLFEGANLVEGGGDETSGLRSLLTGDLEGRLWIGKEKARVELDGRQGDTELVLEKGRITLYSVPENTVYEITLPSRNTADNQPDRTPPTLGQIEAALQRVERKAVLSAATPTDIGGQPAYLLRAAPREKGSLLAGAEVGFAAENGVPLRVGLLSTSSTAPALALELQQVSFAAVPESVFTVQPPAGVKVKRIRLRAAGRRPAKGNGTVRTVGNGLTAVYVLETPTSPHEPSFPYTTGHTTVAGKEAAVVATELGGLVTLVKDGCRRTALGLLPTERLAAALGR
jgi:outer membrane lipoprotein-sorting protein